MPQMAPIMWLTLFLFFIISLSILKSKIFFAPLSMVNYSKDNTIVFQKKNWKW